MTQKVKIEIDGRTCEATPGEMIIAVADRAGIPIPRFCYHKKLSIAANCRMCLVEAEQGGRPFPKLVPACATPVMEGMRVQTRSALAREAQQSTLEFLLINHPLDCPICDQGGECELQDLTLRYGKDKSRYAEAKRVVKDENLGPLIATEMTRCIHCTRCVRFGAEIAGLRELGATGRGDHMRIGTYVEQTLGHELSGNIIDLCPVGALTAKPSRFRARPWELIQVDGIAPHDGLGSHLHLHVRGRQLVRVHPRAQEAINETWISDRDRFSYTGLSAPDRLGEPMIKREGGCWQALEWQGALQIAAERIREAGSELGALIAPNATLEEMYLLQRLVRGLGAQAIDSRLRQQDFRGDAADASLPWLGVSIAKVEEQEGILLIGSDIRQEQPLLAHRVRKAALAGGLVATVNPYRLDLTFPAIQFTASPSGMLRELAALAKALRKRGSGTLRTLISEVKPTAQQVEVAEQLKQAGKRYRGLILLGALATAHPDYSLLRALAHLIADATRAKVGFLPAAANSFGAYLAGALPHRLPGARPAETPGLSAEAMLNKPRKVYLLWGLEPGFDLADPAKAVQGLDRADFVIACTGYRSPALERVADLLLPIALFAETSGTLVNAQLDWQSFRGAIPPPVEARPGWKVLRVLGNLLELEGFDYRSSEEVLEELRKQCAHAKPNNDPRGDLKKLPPRLSNGDRLYRIGNVPIYALDALVRRAEPLQANAEFLQVSLNPDQAAEMGLGAGDQVEIDQGEGKLAKAPVRLDPRIPRGCARIPAGLSGSEQLGPQIGPVSLEKR